MQDNQNIAQNSLIQKQSFQETNNFQQSSIPNISCSFQPQSLPHKNQTYVQATIDTNSILQILYWVTLCVLLLALTYFIYDNHSQSNGINSIMKQLQKHNSQFEQIQNYQLQQDQGKFQNHINITSQLTNFPKKAWYFNRKPMDQSALWTKKCFEIYKHKAQEIGYEFIVINISNYFKYIQKEQYQIIEEQIKNLNNRYSSGTQPQIIKYRDQLIRQIIIMQVLIYNGGIYLDQDNILTQDLSWVDQIHSNQYVNARQLIKTVEFIAFYSAQLSPYMKKSNQIKVDHQTERYIVERPTISSYFIATVKDNRLLKEIRIQFYDLMKIRSKYLKDKLQRQQTVVKFVQKPIHLHKHLFQISSQIALQKKQKIIGAQNSIITHYQIATINENYGPTKIKAYLQQNQTRKIFKHLSQLTRQQIEYQFGKMRYMIKLQPKQEYYDLLLEQIKNKKIVNDSIIHQCFFQSKYPLSFVENVQKQKISNERWQTLPANIWTYSKNHQNHLFSQIWRKYNHFISIESKFKFVILNQQNLHQYLSQESLKKIQSAISSKDNRLQLHEKTKMQMISLAVLYEHGGVWIDPQIFLIGNLQWLRNINQQPYIWNRNAKLPKVLLFFHPHYISPFEWKYNQNKTKQAWHLGYQKDFIAAEPKSQLLKLWLQQYIINLKINYQQLKNKFYHCKIVSNMWIKENNHQFLAQDSLKCILGTKKVQFINTQNSLSPTDYYGLWAINGFSGFYKMRENTDFLSPTRSMQNPFIWRKSFDEMQEIVGKTRYLSVTIEQYCKNNIKNLQNQIHKESFFMKLLTKINDTVVTNGAGVYLAKEVNFAMKSTLKTKGL